MATALPLLAALGIGVGLALQTAMLGGLGRARGPSEAAWLSLLVTVAALALILAVRSLRGDAPLMPAPFDRALVYIAIAIAASAAAATVVRGVPPHFIVTGLFGLAFIVGAAAIAPRIGVALFLAAAITGQLLGGIVLDHLGTFGATVYPASPVRVLGAVMLLAGVVLVRGIGR